MSAQASEQGAEGETLDKSLEFHIKWSICIQSIRYYYILFCISVYIYICIHIYIYIYTQTSYICGELISSSTLESRL